MRLSGTYSCVLLIKSLRCKQRCGRCRAGAVTPLACDSAYAAPEVVNAAQASGTHIAAAAAHDVWPLAVCAFEGLSGSAVAAACGGASGVVACARGEESYPWELPEEELPAGWARSAARPLLEGCLRRPAKARLRAAELADKLVALADAAAA